MAIWTPQMTHLTTEMTLIMTLMMLMIVLMMLLGFVCERGRLLPESTEKVRRILQSTTDG